MTTLDIFNDVKTYMDTNNFKNYINADDLKEAHEESDKLNQICDKMTDEELRQCLVNTIPLIPLLIKSLKTKDDVIREMAINLCHYEDIN